MLSLLAQNALVAAALAVIVAGVCRLGRFRPAVRHALWLVVLLKLMTPPLVWWPWSLADFWPAEPQLASATAPAVEPTAPIAANKEAPAKPSALPDFTPGTAHMAEVPKEVEQTPAVAAAEAPTVAPIPQPPAPPPAVVAGESADLATNLLLVLWMAGAIGMAMLEATRIVRFRRLLRDAVPASRRLRRQVQRLARDISVSLPRTCLVPGLRSPMVAAIGAPRLLWPASLPEDWDTERRQGVILHELAHLRRRDHWVRWLLLIAGCVWWWNPVYWYVRRQLHHEAEAACDAWVVWALPESRRSYAEALIEVSALSALAAAPVPALGVGDACQALQRRLTMIMSERVPCRAPRWGLAVIAGLALATLPAWSFGQTREVQNQVEQQLHEKRVQQLQAELEKTHAELQALRAQLAEQTARSLEARDQATAARDEATKALYRTQIERSQRVIEERNRALKAEAEAKQKRGAADFLAVAGAQLQSKRAWGPEQATGAPDTPEAGDFQTAWASATQDDQDEWLRLEYAEPVAPIAILVYETYNPGAVGRITVSSPGMPDVTWTVKDPTPVGSERGVSIFPLPQQVNYKVKSVTLHIESRRVPGWNEIDAVGLLDANGKVHWATHATASSFFGQEEPIPPAFNPSVVDQSASMRPSGYRNARRDPNISIGTEQRINRLENDMKEVKDTLSDIREMLRRQKKE